MHLTSAFIEWTSGENGTQGMRVADSLQRHARHAGALTHCNGTHVMRARWLTAMVRMACEHADSWEMECYTLCKTTPTWVTARVYLWVCESSAKVHLSVWQRVSHRTKVRLADLQLYWNRGHWVQTASVAVFSYYCCKNLKFLLITPSIAYALLILSSMWLEKASLSSIKTHKSRIWSTRSRDIV